MMGAVDLLVSRELSLLNCAVLKFQLARSHVVLRRRRSQRVVLVLPVESGVRL